MSRTVFLSYSRKDRDLACLFADSLKNAGVSINWDRDIPVGHDYQRVVEEMIDSASCVMVLWSANSVTSQWVRSEASAGLEREILLPVMIQPAKIPIAFKLVQTEDFTSWKGDCDDECWARLMIQVKGMMGHGEVGPAAPAAQGVAASKAPSRSSSAGTVIALLAAVLIAGWTFFSPRSLSGMLGVTVGVAALILILFKMAERDISPRMRALATQWLLPRNEGVRVGSAEALNQLFEAVFGRKHLSAFCFVRSTFVSASLLAILLILARTVLGATVHFNLGVWISLLLYGGAVNVLGDFCALYCTRVMLRFYRNGLNVLVVIGLDTIITAAIFVVTIGLSVLSIFFLESLHAHAAIDRNLVTSATKVVSQIISQPYLAIYEPSSHELLPAGQQRLIYASAITTFMTSIWLWIALLLSPIFRALIWAGGAGLTTIGFIFDVHKAPFSALGYLGATLVIALGGGLWTLGEILKALVRVG